MGLVCEYCGQEGLFEEEEDTGRLYCLQCGHYLEISIWVGDD